MTEQYLYHAVNSFLVYCCLAYILCFATFHLVRSIIIILATMEHLFYQL